MMDKEQIEQFFEERGFPRYTHCEIRDLAIKGMALRAAPEHDTPAGAEAVAYDYQRTFDAIAAATKIEAGHLSVSCKAFWDSYGEREPLKVSALLRARESGIVEGRERAANAVSAMYTREEFLGWQRTKYIQQAEAIDEIRSLAPTKQPDAEGGQLEKWLGNCVCSDNGEKCWQNRRGPLCTQDTSDSLLAALPAVPEKKK